MIVRIYINMNIKKHKEYKNIVKHTKLFKLQNEDYYYFLLVKILHYVVV